jgi:type II secretory pathway component PulF
VIGGRVDLGLVARFSRQLGTYLNSGVPVVKALGNLRDQFAGTPMGPVAGRFQEAVQRGEPISEAAAREPQAFDRLYVALLKVAEARGGMPEMLKRLAGTCEARQRLARQARSALIWPSIVILLAFGVAYFLTAFVLPTLVSILKDLAGAKGISLPWPTRVLIGVTEFVATIGWWLIPLVVGVGGFLLVRWYRTAAGKRAIDPWLMRVPVMGGLIRSIETARMSRTLGELLAAGLPAKASLTLTAEAMQFEPYGDAVREVREAVDGGSEFAPALEATGRFPADAIAFVETGEEAGALPEGLLKVAAEYDERVEHTVKNLASLLQPLFFMVVGAIVGFVAIGFVAAYAAVLTSLAGGG